MILAGVGSQEQPVDAVVLPQGPLHVRQPLDSEARPLQGVGHHQVGQESVLLRDPPLYGSFQMKRKILLRKLL